MIAKILSDNLTYAQVNSENPNICFLHGWGGESNNWKNISKELMIFCKKTILQVELIMQCFLF